MSEDIPGPAEALAELQEIMNLAALESPLQRLAATRYTVCRDALLQSWLRPVLPGFLLQCLTIARFQDFIHLYDPRPEVRLGFIEESWVPTLSRLRSRPVLDVMDDLDF